MSSMLAQLLARACGRCLASPSACRRSIVSTTSPMRSASRAAQAIASAGVSSADGSRWRGFAGSSRRRRRPAAAARRRARSRSVKKMKQQRERDVEGRWNSTTSRAGSSSMPAIQLSRCPTSGTASTQPISLKMRLPSGTRRASGVARSVDSMPSRPLPRLAPSTRPSATGSAITCSDASVAIEQHDREARVRQDREQRPTSMSSSTSPVSEAKITLTPAACTTGCAGDARSTAARA